MIPVLLEFPEDTPMTWIHGLLRDRLDMSLSLSSDGMLVGTPNRHSNEGVEHIQRHVRRKRRDKNTPTRMDLCRGVQEDTNVQTHSNNLTEWGKGLSEIIDKNQD